MRKKWGLNRGKYRSSRKWVIPGSPLDRYFFVMIMRYGCVHLYGVCVCMHNKVLKYRCEIGK